MTLRAPEPIDRAIRRRAAALGFDQTGFCRADPPAERTHFERWLDQGMHAGMSWLQRGRAKRLDPRLVLESARSIIVVTLGYADERGPDTAASPNADAGIVSRYAAGDDYHKMMGGRLMALEEYVESLAPGHRAMAYVDTGPILERMWAARAGIGWVGKNALILNKERGSYFFLGVIITSLELPADAPALDQCGSCSRCVEACPTGAIVEPRVVDSRRCVAYHTIELKGRIPEEHRAAIGRRIFGCDDCQEACPWNGPGAPPQREPLSSATLTELLSMTQAGYMERFRGSAMRRATHQGLRRNAALALGNTASDPATLRALLSVAKDPGEDSVVREQAQWSADRIRARLGAAGMP